MKTARPEPVTLEGRTVDLVPLALTHADDLFPYLRASNPDASQLLQYMPESPYADLESLRSNLAAKFSSPDRFFAVIDKRPSLPSTGKAVGYLSLMNIVPEHHRLEIGHVLFAPPLQRTTGATEALYFALGYAFFLGNMRVEWKCNALNKGSRRAAERLGFSFEGVFRMHMWVKGLRRDTAWYSVLREEWIGEEGRENGLIHAMERWLEEANFENDKQVTSLERLREHK